MRNVIVYVRPWNSNQMMHLAREVWPNQQLQILSEHKSVDSCGLHGRFYSNLRSWNPQAVFNNLSDAQVSDIILRCRLLRMIEVDIARRYVWSMEKALDQQFSGKVPIAVLSQTVDSYILHILFILCRIYRVPFVGLVPTFVNGYVRCTGIGERVFSRKVEDDEIEEVKATLMHKSYKPNFLAKNESAVKKKAVIEWAKNLIKPSFFQIVRWLTGDAHNYHYLVSEKIAKRYQTILPRILSGSNMLSAADLIHFSHNKPLIYFPLQMSPEATVDYWAKEKSWIDYEDKVLSIVRSYSDSHIFFVKEHPNVVGMRSPGFYKELEKCDNCLMVLPEFSSNEVLAKCDAVLICTGSVGFEAALRGIRVFSDCKPFHLHPGLESDIQRMKYFENKTTDKSSDCVDINEKIRYLLEGIFPGKFVNNGTWRLGRLRHLEDNKNLAKQIIKLLEFNPELRAEEDFLN